MVTAKATIHVSGSSSVAVAAVTTTKTTCYPYFHPNHSMPFEQCCSDRIECMVQFQGELNPLGRDEHDHALELDVGVEDEFVGRDVAFWKGGGVRVAWPFGMAKANLKVCSALWRA